MASGKNQGNTSNEDALKEEVESLKKELDAIKQIEEDPHPIRDLQDSIDHLNDSVNVLTSLFEKAGKLVDEDNKLQNQKIEMVMEQNKSIAKGLIAMANLIKSQGYIDNSPTIEPETFDSEPEMITQEAPPDHFEAPSMEEEYPMEYQNRPAEMPPMGQLPPSPDDLQLGEGPPLQQENVPMPPPKKGFFSKFTK